MQTFAELVCTLMSDMAYTFSDGINVSVLLQLYLYGKDTKKVTYNEFVNRELVLFSNMDNERSIPSLVDGKCHLVMFTCDIFLLFIYQDWTACAGVI